MKRIFTTAQKKVIFFDINGTLLSKKRSWEVSFTEGLEALTGRWSGKDEGWDAAAVLKEYKQELRRKLKFGKRSVLGMEALQVDCLRNTLKPYPFNLDKAILRAWLRSITKKKRSRFELMKDVKSTLEVLSAHYVLAVISNGSKAEISSSLNRTGMGNLIKREHIFTSQKGRWKKPDTAIFRNACKQMNLAPQQAVMVGNSLKNDVEGAILSGMDAVWLNSSSKKAESLKIMHKTKFPMICSFKQLLILFETA